jgi:hypothetical protein
MNKQILISMICLFTILIYSCCNEQKASKGKLYTITTSTGKVYKDAKYSLQRSGFSWTIFILPDGREVILRGNFTQEEQIQ